MELRIFAWKEVAVCAPILDSRKKRCECRCVERSEWCGVRLDDFSGLRELDATPRAVCREPIVYTCISVRFSAARTPHNGRRVLPGCCEDINNGRSTAIHIGRSFEDNCKVAKRESCGAVSDAFAV